MQMNSTRRNGLLKQINTNFNNTISNSTEEYTKIGNNGVCSTNKKIIPKKIKLKILKPFFINLEK